MRRSIPRNNPAAQTASAAGTKNNKAFRVASGKLSARHPSVFGVSRRPSALTSSHKPMTQADCGHAACQRQMYRPTKIEKASASAKYELRQAGRLEVNSAARLLDRR